MRKRVFKSSGMFVEEQSIFHKLAIAVVVFLGVFAVAAFATTGSPIHISGKPAQTATVEGVVKEVHVARSGVTFVDIGGAGREFVAVIWPEDSAKFPNVASLYGQTVKISGTVRTYRGHPEIILSGVDQITQ